MGKNGAGKTTLLKIILGLRRTQKDCVTTYGSDPSKRELDFLQNYFFIPEDPHIPNISMKEYIERYAPFYPSFSRDDFFKLLNEFELPRSLHFKNLSFGQKKKALIAFAIASNTKLLVMDEPTNSLDIPSKKQFRKIVTYVSRPDRLFIVSTHQIRDLHSLIDHVLLIDHGKLLVDRSIEDIENAVNFEVYRKEPDNDDILYYERVPGGYLALKAGGMQHNSLEVDLEVLFNAVITHNDLFYPILNSA